LWVYVHGNPWDERVSAGDDETDSFKIILQALAYVFPIVYKENEKVNCSPRINSEIRAIAEACFLIRPQTTSGRPIVSENSYAGGGFKETQGNWRGTTAHRREAGTSRTQQIVG
jgi:hypothetical protein